MSKKILVAVLLSFIFFGCERYTTEEGKTFTNRSLIQNILCIDGVLYYYYGSGLAAAFNPDGSLKLCNKVTEGE